MKITFNLINCGLANNGGSQTIVNSANTLTGLGHNVTIIDSFPNKYTWDELRAKHIIVKTGQDIPNSDVIIATGFKTVASTVDLPASKGKPFHWIRGWELWNYAESHLQYILKAPTAKIVNGVQLQDKLKSCGVESTIVRPGYDFEDYHPLNHRSSFPTTIIGGLYSEGQKRITKRTEWIINAVRQLKAEKFTVRLRMFGIHRKPSINDIDLYTQLPTITQKNLIYNQCHAWLAPTELEGLHLPPAEAMLTECPVVGTNAPLSGMSDYLIDGQTGLVADNNFESFYNKILEYIKLPIQTKIMYGSLAREKILELGSRRENMLKMNKVLSCE